MVRKAGQKPCECKHEEPEVFQNIWKHFKSDGVPDQAANHMAAEILTSDDFEGSIEDFERYYSNYKEKGYNEHAAQAMAVEAMEGRESPPLESMRFARIYLD